MTDESTIATHSEPAWRRRTNFIIQLDLSAFELPGKFEQLWTHTDDQQHFELCCIPFFTYGYSLGDVLSIDLASGGHRIVRKGGHRTIRFAFTDDRQAHEHHEALHGALVQDAHCLVELRQGNHYGAIDIDTASKDGLVTAILSTHADAGYLIWEWADPTTED